MVDSAPFLFAGHSFGPWVCTATKSICVTTSSHPHVKYGPFECTFKFGKISIVKVELCKFLGKVDKSGKITIKTLGKARNNIAKPMLAGWEKVTTSIVIDKAYEKGLDGIKDYSHVIVVYWMDKELECHLKHHPQGREDIPFVGIFACRCPQRPNRIAIST